MLAKEYHEHKEFLGPDTLTVDSMKLAVACHLLNIDIRSIRRLALSRLVTDQMISNDTVYDAEGSPRTFSMSNAIAAHMTKRYPLTDEESLVLRNKIQGINESNYRLPVDELFEKIGIE